jgi:two-component system sensor histidine kinase YesM
MGMVYVISKFLYRYSNLKLRWQLMILYASIAALIFTIVGGYLTMSLTRVLYDYAVEHHQNALDKVIADMITLGKTVDYCTNMLLMNNTLHELIDNTNFDDISKYFDNCKQFEELNNQIQLINNEYYYKIYHKNYNHRVFGNLITYPSYDGNEAVFKMLVTKNIPKGYSLLKYGKDEQESWVLYSPIKNVNKGFKTIGILLTFIRPTTLRSIIHIDNNVELFVFSQNGELLYTTKENIENKTFERESLSKKSAEYIYLERMIINSATSFDGLTISCLIPVADINAHIFSSVVKALLAALVSFLLTFYIVHFYIKRFNIRLSILINGMNEVRAGNYGVEIENRHKDEIGSLYDSFNSMSSTLKDTTEKYIQAEVEKQTIQSYYDRSKAETSEARLLALQRQIDPHYLYNTLESIRMGLIIKGDRETANVIMNFAAGFKSLTIAEGAKCKLLQELKIVKNYIQVLKYRYEGIDFNMNIEKFSHFKIEIPIFSIQPIVENAVIHGIMEQGGQGKIELKIKDQSNHLSISVTDNGIGMTKDQLDTLWEELLNNNSLNSLKGIALRNLYTRYKILYGDRFKFNIYSAKNIGTCFEILIRRDEKGNV